VTVFASTCVTPFHFKGRNSLCYKQFSGNEVKFTATDDGLGIWFSCQCRYMEVFAKIEAMIVYGLGYYLWEFFDGIWYVVLDINH